MYNSVFVVVVQHPTNPLEFSLVLVYNKRILRLYLRSITEHSMSMYHIIRVCLVLSVSDSQDNLCIAKGIVFDIFISTNTFHENNKVSKYTELESFILFTTSAECLI